MEMKNCARLVTGKCASGINPQPYENFAKDKKRPDGITPWCKSCLKKYRDENKESRAKVIKAWAINNPDKVLASRRKSAPKANERTRLWKLKNPDYRFKKEYGIDHIEYDRMYNLQNGCCAICNKHQSVLKKKLHVDHCHSSNNIRGLLCHHCNMGIGSFMDKIDFLKSAIDYLSKEPAIKREKSIGLC